MTAFGLTAEARRTGETVLGAAEAFAGQNDKATYKKNEYTTHRAIRWRPGYCAASVTIW
jgi:hypothetical protein